MNSDSTVTDDQAAAPRVGVVLGSDSDAPLAEALIDELRALGIAFEVRVLSAHRSPRLAAEYAATAAGRGIRVLIGIAGMANHLAGALAAHSLLPVLGVPAAGGLMDGLDALLSTVQMPPGIPVGALAVGRAGARNAAVLAGRILALGDPELAARLAAAREHMTRRVEEADRRIQETLRP